MNQTQACRTNTCTSSASCCLCSRIRAALDIIETNGWTHEQLTQVVWVLESMATETAPELR